MGTLKVRSVLGPSAVWFTLSLQARARPSRHLLGTPGLALMLIAASPPHEPLRLKWMAPSGCPSVEQVRNDVDALLSNQARSGPGSVEAVAAIQVKAGGGYSLSLTANGQSRVIDDENCERLAQAAALLLALLVDPARSASIPDGVTPSQRDTSSTGAQPATALGESAGSGGTGTNSLPSAEPTSRTSPSTEQLAKVEVRGLAEVGARLDVGNWPSAQPAVLVGLGVERGHIQLRAHASLGKHVQLPYQGGGKLDLVVASFDVVPEYRLAMGRWALATGVGAEVGFTRTSSQHLEPSARNSFSFSAIAPFRLSRDLGQALHVWIEPAAGYPLVRPRWVLVNGVQVHRYGSFLRVQGGLEVSF